MYERHGKGAIELWGERLVKNYPWLVASLLFPVGFCLLYLMGFDLLTGVFTLAPLAVIAKRPGNPNAPMWVRALRSVTLELRD